MNLLGKIAKPSRESVLEFWISETSFFERDSVFFASLPSRRPSLQFVNNPETKQGGDLYDR